MTANFEMSMIQAILPAICLVVLGIIIMVVDLSLKENKKGVLGWVAAGGLLVALLIILFFGRPGDTGQSVWGGMVRFDLLGFVFTILVIIGAIITSLLALDAPVIGKKGEFYLLLLASTLGMTLMVSAGNLVMLYVAIETTSIPMYILAGFLIEDNKSTNLGSNTCCSAQ